MASSKMRARKLSVIKISPSVNLLSVLLFSACIDQNAGGREWGKVITRKSIKVVSVPEIAGGYCQGMCLDNFFFSDLPGRPQTELYKIQQHFPCYTLQYRHTWYAYAGCEQSVYMHGRVSTDHYDLQSEATCSVETAMAICRLLHSSIITDSQIH